MAPERLRTVADPRAAARPTAADRHRADIYSLGVLLLEMLTGRAARTPRGRPAVAARAGVVLRLVARARRRGDDPLGPRRRSRPASGRSSRVAWRPTRPTATAGRRSWPRTSTAGATTAPWPSPASPGRPSACCARPAAGAGRSPRWRPAWRSRAVATAFFLSQAQNRPSRAGGTGTIRKSSQRGVRRIPGPPAGQRTGSSPRQPGRDRPAAPGPVRRPRTRRRLAAAATTFRALPSPEREELEVWLLEQALRFAHALGRSPRSPADWQRALVSLEQVAASSPLRPDPGRVPRPPPATRPARAAVPAKAALAVGRRPRPGWTNTCSGSRPNSAATPARPCDHTRPS